MNKLVSTYTMEQLVQMEAEASKKGNKKRAENLRWAITHKIRELRDARGEVTNDAGYSGRNSKRRR